MKSELISSDFCLYEIYSVGLAFTINICYNAPLVTSNTLILVISLNQVSDSANLM